MGRSLKVAPQHINTVKLALKRQGFPSQTALKEEVGLARSTVSKFLNGESVDRWVFLELCEKLGQDWQDIADKEVETALPTPSDSPSHPFQPSTYNAETWVERQQPLAEATEHLRGNCCILLITGITGQGKTALAERVAVELSGELQSEWQPLRGVNLDDETARNFEVAVERLLVQMGETVQAEDRTQPQFLLNRLVKRLQENPYLVPIDSLEVLLEGKTDFAVHNEFREEYRDWWQFCQRLLLSPTCQSRLILTSQDLPTQFASCKSRFWHQLSLSGLNGDEQMQLFEKLLGKQLPEISPEAQEYLKRMGNAYEGHSLVLEVIAGEIATDFAGNVVGYWQRYRREFEEIEATPGNQQLQRRVKVRVRQSLERLQQDSEAAFGLLLAASVYRRKVPESFWLAMVEGEDGDNLLEMLKLRGLTIREYNPQLGEFFLRQHNLIRNTAGEWLHKKMPELWKAVHYMAVKVWLNQYQPEPDAENLEKVRGYLEAFYHCCQVEDWEAVKEILNMRVDSPTQEQLHNQLQTWGYYRQQIKLLSQLLGKLNNRWTGICFNGMGNAYHSLGEYQRAIDFYQQYLAIAREIGNRNGEGTALGNLGVAYQFLGEYQRAIDFYQQHLAIAREIGDRNGEGTALGNLGLVYQSLREYQRAIDFHQRSLAVAKEIKNYQGEGIALVNFGKIEFTLERYSKALENMQRALEIFETISSRSGEATALQNLAAINEKLGNIDVALEYCDRALKIATELGIPLAQDCQDLKERLLNPTS
ncbi:tetratricopeptide repeat protein [Oscillatoriales cyanobacterium LEGE 11467]|uniref:Tetratricopeptide repeat protein n=1 Tax=Zarconia navalis LEGE 11467 TaxID=1828826 RepID=A0A928VWX3_9CYAN|nr:tetratricopeptide repeat protein [Zarconia navalis]MBE9040788.1 tetratricopeptide repeat protein [Zarconia navalis LEGE 11467]